MSSPQPTQKFRRILWESQDFEDNYTPPSFPYCVVFNEDARIRSFRYLLTHSLWILDHISLVILFFDIFLLSDNGSIYSSSLFATDISLVLLGLIISFCLLYFHTSPSPKPVTQKKKKSGKGKGNVKVKGKGKGKGKGKNKNKQKSASLSPSPPLPSPPSPPSTLSNTLSSIKNKIERTYILGVLLIILCPLLRTLTESISTDTIWTMTIICAVIHLLTADYEFDKYKNGNHNDNKIQFSISSYDSRITATVSLNAAVFMSVLLASRLKSNDLALSFLLFSFILFGGAPYIIRDIKLMNKFFNVIISVFICAVNYGLIYYQQEIIDNLRFISIYIRNILPFNFINDEDKYILYDYRNDIRLSSLLYVYEYSMFVIVILGPIGFYRIQQYKVTIGGPWTYDTEGEASQYMVDSSNIKKQ